MSLVLAPCSYARTDTDIMLLLAAPPLLVVLWVFRWGCSDGKRGGGLNELQRSGAAAAARRRRRTLRLRARYWYYCGCNFCNLQI